MTKEQTFTVTIKYLSKDGCGNELPTYTEGDIRRALAKELDHYSSIVVTETERRKHKPRATIRKK